MDAPLLHILIVIYIALCCAVSLKYISSARERLQERMCDVKKLRIAYLSQLVRRKLVRPNIIYQDKYQS